MYACMYVCVYECVYVCICMPAGGEGGEELLVGMLELRVLCLQRTQLVLQALLLGVSGHESLLVRCRHC